MMKPATVIKWVIVLLIGLATASSACAGAQNYIEVKNDWSHSMWAIFKCYTNQPWESNTCRYENTYIFIKPGKSHNGVTLTRRGWAVRRST